MISLAEALERARQGRLRGRTISVTFDDGYADNFAVALPILERFEVPATFFVSSGFVDGGRMWNDSITETFRLIEPGTCEIELPGENAFDLTDWTSRRNAADSTITAWKHLPPKERQARVDALASRVHGLPADLMLTKTQLRQLAQSPFAAIGGHTRNHPILASLPDSEAAEEIEGGKRDLEDWIQSEIRHFAYPNGRLGRDYDARHAALARQTGFDAAVATDWGTLETGGDHYAIPRFTPWQRDLSRFSIDLARCHFGLL
jgi:peptidoglycan/xylan/chitin deacetylase (PgdA/CDA1 family)